MLYSEMKNYFCPIKPQMENKEYITVEKEEVANLTFPHEDVLDGEPELIQERKLAVERANSLGNNEHYKVKIYFADNNGKKQVNTTIWAVTDQAIVLKQNVILPIKRIIKLEI